ncbi:MAG: hybrid sensor histidine kinase/response regulator [Bacteriovoracaceae bacterium]|nr:hybrid sensor histidine kinase/response regulator [Bacteriovoracaceae bacterium]
MKDAKILAVDDDFRNLEIIKEIVEDHYNLNTAISGEEALMIIQESMPDIILLDIMMSGIDGYEVCQRIKSLEGIVPPKIILVSGKALVEERLKGYELGADDYLTKPFNDDELLAKINVFLKLIATEKELRELTTNLEDQVQVRTKQLIESEKMAFLGMHMAEAVHNLKNPLTIIKAAAQKLSKELPENRYLEKIARGGEKLNVIIASILQAEESSTDIAEIDLNKLLQAEMDMLRDKPVFSEDTKIVWELGEVKTVRGSEIHFSQIFSNLLGNAIDALHDADKKELKIKTQPITGMVEISISDSGTGISKENIEKIFNPFFTTKPIEAEEGEPTGTGLGLPSCKKMVESYGGKIEVSSQQDVGTEFKITLPPHH